jgi:hypothetical protein
LAGSLEQKCFEIAVNASVSQLGTSIDPATKYGKPFHPTRPRAGGDPS